MDPEKARSRGTLQSDVFEYRARDVILYALGVGARTDEDLRYLYENHEEFCALPTFIVAPGLLANTITDWPGVEFDITRILHGEHYIEMFAPLPTDGKLRSEVSVVDILDKGTGAVVLSNITTYDAAKGTKIAMQQFATFQVGSGNFGGTRTSQYEKPCEPVPQRAPDAVIEQKTHTDQAALYRLGSGDVNPLHIDPQFAKLMGFRAPILHGLCSLGFSTRHVLKVFANNDTNLFKAIKVRFSNPVVPGQTLQTEMWKEGNRIHFQTKVKETGKIAISSAYTDLRHASTVSSVPLRPAALKSQQVFDDIARELPNHRDIVNKVNGIVLYELTQNGELVAKMTLDLKNGTGSVYAGEPRYGDKPSAVMTIEDDDFVSIMEGKLDVAKAFVSGRIKAEGDMLLLQKLHPLMKGAVQSKI